MVALFRPPFGYWLRVLIGLNVVTTVRFWTEHFDDAIGRAAHTYRFPFSFGIGNHAVHHEVVGRHLGHGVAEAEPLGFFGDVLPPAMG